MAEKMCLRLSVSLFYKHNEATETKVMITQAEGNILILTPSRAWTRVTTKKYTNNFIIAEESV